MDIPKQNLKPFDDQGSAIFVNSLQRSSFYSSQDKTIVSNKSAKWAKYLPKSFLLSSKRNSNRNSQMSGLMLSLRQQESIQVKQQYLLPQIQIPNYSMIDQSITNNPLKINPEETIQEQKLRPDNKLNKKQGSSSCNIIQEDSQSQTLSVQQSKFEISATNKRWIYQQDKPNHSQTKKPLFGQRSAFQNSKELIYLMPPKDTHNSFVKKLLVEEDQNVDIQKQ